MQALERGEELSSASHIETRSVVLHAKDILILFLENKRDPGIRLSGCELPGVTQQVFQRNLDETLVTACREPFGDLDGHLSCGISHAEIRNDAGSHLREIDLFDAERGAVHS